MTTLWQHDVRVYALNLVQTLMYGTLAFMISSAFRSSAMAIAIPALLLLAGKELVLFLQKNAWMKYMIISNTDLVSHVEGPTVFKDTTLGFALGMLALYFVAFHLIAWYTFNKRDVAA